MPRRIKLNDQVSVKIYSDGIMHLRIEGFAQDLVSGKPASVTFRLYGELTEITPESVVELVAAQDSSRGVQCTQGLDDKSRSMATYHLAPDDLAKTLAAAFGVEKPKKPWWKFW